MSAISDFFAHPNEAFRAGFYRNDDFDFDVRLTLGAAVYGAADPGEVLSAIAEVGNNDHEAWFAAWKALGARVMHTAETCAERGHRHSAANAYLRAASYFGVAFNAVDGLKSTDELVPTFRLHRQAWDGFVDHAAYRVDRVEIPYEDTTLPGYFFRASRNGPAPTLVMINGSDGPISSLWSSGAAGALERGFHVLMFDGPGQQTMLFERNTAFRYDFENVLTPVTDFVLARDDVDPNRLALYGISQAGYWVPRALSFEHRYAAAVADPGVVDVSTSWLGHLPKNLIALLEKGDRDQFDREMATGMKISRSASRAWNFRSRPYQKDDYFDTLTDVLKFRLGDEISQIRTPLFISNPEDEQFWPGQSAQLASRVPHVATLVDFTRDEGANFHCQPLARLLTDQRMFDWLEDQFTARTSS